MALGRRSRWVVIGVWLALAVALAPLQPKLQTIASDESDTFFTRGADSTEVDRLLDSRFPEAGDSTAVIAYETTEGSIYERTPEISQDMQELCATPTLPALEGVGGPDGPVCGELGHELGPQNPPTAFSADSPESMVLFSVVNGRDDTESVAADVAAIRALLPGPDARGTLRSYVTGEAGFEADRSVAVEGLDGTLLAITGALVLILMLVTYRSPLIAALMLGVVAVAYLIATGLVYGLVQADVTTVSGQSTAILIVLMFGAGTDYCLLIVSRFRDELARMSDVEKAMKRAAARTGPAIFASGGIVVAAMLVLALADFNATREMGPLLALGIVVMMACGLTLLPALLAAFGRRAFWPAVPREQRAAQTSARWTRIGAVVRRRPGLLAASCTALLALGALGNLEGRGYLNLAEQFRVEPESVVAQNLIRERFEPAGRVAPVDVVTSSAVALEVKDALAKAPGVATSNTDSDGGDVISLEVLLDIDPFSSAAIDLIPRLREVAREAAGGELALIGGITAESYDNREALRSDSQLIVPLVLGVILLVLIALLRCIVAPLYVIGTVILSFAFALGASSLIFTHVFGQPDSDPTLWLFSFMFLVALGVDDNIFLMSRIREERRRGLATRDAVITGLEKTGGVITSAGLILAGTFAALMALELEALFQVGFTVALGLLVDAFVVRTFLVPSIALLLGERNWWPRILSGDPRN
ncbi:MAG TPA: MMPL family transporter [Solirubrobacter sp.]|nr:MMPL family transporter [Solirubrobacter sp.]